jgi:hypothetical protein
MVKYNKKVNSDNKKRMEVVDSNKTSQEMDHVLIL